MFDPYAVLARALEREQALLWNLKELLASIDSSSIGPAVRLLPRWQIERVELAIDTSEEELRMLDEVLGDMGDVDFEGD